MQAVNPNTEKRKNQWFTVLVRDFIKEGFIRFQINWLLGSDAYLARCVGAWPPFLVRSVPLSGSGLLRPGMIQIEVTTCAANDAVVVWVTRGP